MALHSILFTGHPSGVEMTELSHGTVLTMLYAENTNIHLKIDMIFCICDLATCLCYQHLGNDLLFLLFHFKRAELYYKKTKKNKGTIITELLNISQVQVFICAASPNILWKSTHYLTIFPYLALGNVSTVDQINS